MNPLCSLRMLNRWTIEKEGFAILPRVLSGREQQTLIKAVGQINGAGRRDVLDIAEVKRLAYSTRLLELVAPYVAAKPCPVRAIYFDKSPKGNWLVSWHQ